MYYVKMQNLKGATVVENLIYDAIDDFTVRSFSFLQCVLAIQPLII